MEFLSSIPFNHNKTIQNYFAKQCNACTQNVRPVVVTCWLQVNIITINQSMKVPVNEAREVR